jgi:hypothetical protein
LGIPNDREVFIMKRNLFKKSLIGLVLIAILMANALAAFAGSATSAQGYYTVYNHNYFNESSITTGIDPNGKPYANAYTGAMCNPCEPSNSVPAGYLGAKARLFNASNQLISQTEFVYNSSSDWVEYSDSARLSPAVLGAAYYSYGITAAYNGNGYTTYYTFVSPSQNAN